MAELKSCDYCKAPFMGRANQWYCCNAHKTTAFRDREQEDKQRVEALSKPTYFLKHFPSGFHMRNFGGICQELNLIQQVYEAGNDLINLQGTDERSYMVGTIKENRELYLQRSHRITEKLQKGEYAQKFTAFMEPHLEKLPKLYGYMAAKLTQALRKVKKQGSVEEVSVEFDATFLDKMHKTAQLYADLWLRYKNKCF